MANVDRPIGFRPAIGIGNQHLSIRIPIDASNGTNAFVGDVMDLNSAGSVRPASADAGVSAAGVCIALFDSDGNPVGSPNSSVSTKYLPLSTAGFALVDLALPGAIFIAQTITGQVPTSSDVGITSDHTAGTGDTITARSRHELTHSGGGLQFRYVGIVGEPTNSYGENVDLYVVFNESAFGVSAAASV